MADVEPTVTSWGALFAEPETLERALEATGVALFELDFETGRARFSKSCLKLFGEVSSEHAQLDTIEKLYRRAVGPELSAIRDAVEHADRSAQSFAGRCRMRSSLGEHRWFHFRGTAERKRAIGLFEDVEAAVSADEQRAKLDAQIVLAKRMEAVSTLAGGVAQDLNNLLSPMLLHCDLALGQLPPGSSARADLEDLRLAALRARELVERLLVFGQRRHESYSLLRPVDIVRDTIQALTPQAPRNVTIEFHAGPDLPSIMGSSVEFGCVVSNLLLNAFEAMRNKAGPIKVELTRAFVREDVKDPPGLAAGHWLRLRVTDTGVGMDTSVRERVFEPFFTTWRRGSGAGLGLATTHAILLAHGGSIFVDSAPQEGATFDVYLPPANLPQTPVKPVAPPPPPEKLARRIGVLFVDDEVAICRAMRRLLGQFDVDITTCSDPQEALEFFTKDPEQFELVITDYLMPEMTGPTLLNKLRAIKPDITAILMSGYTHQTVTTDAATDLGFYAVLPKPMSVPELRTAVAAALAHIAGKGTTR